jgi:hypothetical protein
MYGEILQAVKTLATFYASPYTKIELGAMPIDNGLAMYLGAGALEWDYLNRGSVNSISVALNGKHTDQQTVVTVLSTIHKSLTRLKEYPAGADWKILNIKTASAPNYIERDGQWLYGSTLDIQFYLEGV